MLVKKKPAPVQGDVRKIPLSRGMYAIVDADDYEWLSQFHWHAKKSKHNWYAVRKVRRNGKLHYIKIHREITKAAPGTHVHHKNSKSLDNRKSNLKVMWPKDHYETFLYR